MVTDVLPDRAARLWILKYAKQQYKRLTFVMARSGHVWLDLDDLVQEGYAAYYDVRRRHPTAVEPAHIQSLLQLVFRSRIEDIARKASRRVPKHLKLQEVEPDPAQFLNLMVAAPDVVKKTLAILTDPSMRHVLDKPFGRLNNGRRENLNDRLCSLLGLNSKRVDVVKQTKNYFSYQ